MNLIRVLIVIAVAWLLYQLVKGYLEGKKAKAAQKTGSTSETMVKCAYCDLHIPEGEACERDGKFYCSREHMELDAPA